MLKTVWLNVSTRLFEASLKNLAFLRKKSFIPCNNCKRQKKTKILKIVAIAICYSLNLIGFYTFTNKQMPHYWIL